MPDFNCDCESTSNYDTLLTLRTKMMVALGFAAQKASPPPGMADMIDGWLSDAQKELYAKNPSLRTERRFRWTLLKGEGFYGIRDDDPLAKPDQSAGTGGTIAFTAAQLLVGTTPAGISQFDLDGQGVGGTLTSGDFAGFNYFQIYWVNASGGELHVALRVPTSLARVSPQTAYFTNLNIAGVTNGTRTAASATFTTAVQGADTVYTWVWGAAALSGSMVSGTSYTAQFTPVSAQTYCAKHLNEYKISSVWLEDLDGSFSPLLPGIPMSYYNSVDELGFPSRYEIRSCIEVFPRPSASGMKLWMAGQMDLDAFTADADRTTIDSHLVYLWALAAGKEHYGKKDAATVRGRAGAYLLDAISGKHGTNRYIPRREEMPPEVEPVMTVYNTGP